MKFKYVALKRPCPQLGVSATMIRNEEGKNGTFCENTGGIFIKSSKCEDLLYIPAHNISFVAFEIEKKEINEIKVKDTNISVEKETKKQPESVKENGACIKTNSREVSKTRTSPRKSPRSTKATRKSTTKNN